VSNQTLERSSTPGPASRQSWRQNEDLRRLGTLLLVGLAVALMTGPSGNRNEPTAGFRGSWFAPRVFVYLLVFAGIAGLMSLYERTKRDRGGASLLEPVTRPITSVRDRLSKDAKLRYAVYAVILLVAVLYPQTLPPFWQRVLVDQIGVYVLLALGLNIVVGLAGLLDLGYIAFFAIGAYTTAYFTDKLPVHPPFTLNPFEVFPIAVLATLIAGVLLGGPTLRLRGDYLAIVTLGFGEIVRILAVNGDSFFGTNVTNGPRGANQIPHFSLHVLGIDYDWKLTSLPYYYLLLVIIVGLLIAFNRLENSRVGRAWTAVREDEVAAAATGVPTVKYKLMAFAIGASTSGFAGVFYASKVGFISPDNFLLLFSILVLTMVIFGGMGSLPGVILGAAVLQWLPQVLRGRVPSEDRYIYFGALLILLMIVRPQGLLPSRRRALEIKMSEEGVGGADSLGATPGGAAA
jgi:branched-chain amino acid transport system permease protein